MATPLRIGEVAQLLGITPKTIRHYHQLGLLADPTRTTANYRTYGASDLIRLLRIRRLQALGLSLRQVRTVLGAPEGEQPLPGVLTRLAAEIDGQIAALQARRTRIQQILDGGMVDVAGQPVAVSDVLIQARGEVEAMGFAVSDDLWQQDIRLFGLLEELQWPGSLIGDLQTAEQELLAAPERYGPLLALAEQLAALAQVPEDDPAVARLAAEAAASSELRAMVASLPDHAGPAEPFGQALEAVLLSALTPAQRRFLALVRQLKAQS